MTVDPTIFYKLLTENWKQKKAKSWNQMSCGGGVFRYPVPLTQLNLVYTRTICVQISQNEDKNEKTLLVFVIYKSKVITVTSKFCQKT